MQFHEKQIIGSKNCQIQEIQSFNENDQQQNQVWENVFIQYQNEIQLLQQQLWENGMNKIYNQNRGVPKKIIESLKKMKIGKSSKQCSVCCNQFNKDEVIIQLPCKHMFHQNCGVQWLQKSRQCPNCRADVVEELKKQQEK